MVKELKEAGFEDVVVFEKLDGPGGTWRINRYPGCACDVQAALYSFSWAIKPDWSRPYPPQPEILAYFEDIAERYGVLPHCRFGVEVTGAVWDDATATWRISTAGGEVVEADVLVSAIGMFRDPIAPEIEGIDSFAGTMFHSARWDESHDLHDERVAIIGSAASAVQLTPVVAETAERTHLFQRTANWILPKPDKPYGEQRLQFFRDNPDAVEAIRAEIFRLMDEGMTFEDPDVVAEREAAGLAAIAVVRDPVVRAKLTPTHPFGCKRPLFSNGYYPSFNRRDLELVTDPIERVTPHGIVTADGTVRSVDTVILATGFQTTRYVSVIDVVGRDERHIADVWEDGAEAYLGITTAGFPNLFMLYGPNTNNGSILTMIEYQVAHVVSQLERMRDERLAWVDVKPGPMAAYNEDVQAKIRKIDVWQADCNGYYRSRTGRIVTQWPFSMTQYARRTSTIDVDAFETGPAA